MTARSLRFFFLGSASLVLLGLGGCNSVSVGSDCVSSRDCTGAGLVCDTGASQCVECLGDADCLVEGQLCLARSCVAVTACESSRQCPGQVCDSARGYCVDCVGDVDCPSGLVCRSSTCVEPPTTCQSDRECSAMGLVCEPTVGQCVQCVRDADCDPGLSCRGDRTCGFVGCTVGEAECDGEGRRVCAPDGTWQSEACGSGETCAGGQCFCGGGGGCGAQGECSDGVCGCGGGPSCTVSQACIGGSCVENDCGGSCGTGEQCVGTECRCGNGPACATGSCVAGQCTSDTTCPESPCRLTGPQCGCGAEQRCTVEGESGTRHCEAAGLKSEGERCDESSPCAAGLGCLAFGSASFCVTYCDPDDGSRCNGEPGSDCGIPITSNGAAIPNAQVCGIGCDLRLGTGCPVGDACAIIMPETQGFAATVCRAAGLGNFFGCFGPEDCPSGQTCGESGVCETYCRVGGSDCLASRECVALDREPVIDGSTWGTCREI